MEATLLSISELEDVLLRAAREGAALALSERDADAWFDVAGAARFASMTDEAIRAATKRGQLRAHRSTTGRLRYRREDVDAFLRGDAA